VFDFISVAPFLKFNISTMCHYKTKSLWKVNYQNSYTYIFIYIAVTLNFLYFFSKIL
jgi:hypothetical protein